MGKYVDENRGHWTNKWTFIMAAAGAATGLGNIWKFPYMAGDNGGGAFVLVYIVCVILIGLPLMAGEVMVGRRAQVNPIDGLSTLAAESGRTRKWQALGWWGMAALLVTLSFYSVVAGWSLFYLFKNLAGTFVGLSATQVTEYWQHFLAQPQLLLLCHSIFLFLTLFVVARGVQQGLERASTIMMPLLLLLLLFLVGFAWWKSSTDFVQAFHYLFDPDFSKITGGVIIDALGHAFFTLAIGVGAMAIYGSYLPKHISIGQATVVTVVLDVLVAFLAGLAIFPILFSHGISPEQGPGLMFIALPIAFAQMHWGQWIGSLFFVLLLFAAWTSSINIAEPLIASLYEKTRLSRAKSCWVVGVVVWLLGIVSVLSFNWWDNVKLFGHMGLFTAITDLSTNIFLPVGGICYAIFVGWMMKKSFTQSELSFRSNALYSVWLFLVRFVAPVSIFVVFISALFTVS